MDRARSESLKVGFDGSIKLEFHGAKVTSDRGFLAYRDLDGALGLFDSVSTVFSDCRTGRNVQHDMTTLFYINPFIVVLQCMKMLMIHSIYQLIL